MDCKHSNADLMQGVVFSAEKSYNFFPANQQKANLKFNLWTQFDFRVNRCYWRILPESNTNIRKGGQYLNSIFTG